MRRRTLISRRSSDRPTVELRRPFDLIARAVVTITPQMTPVEKATNAATARLAVPARRNDVRRPTQEAMMARDIAVAALVAFSAGVVSGVIVTTALTVRSKGRRNSVVGLSLDLLEIKVRRLMGASVHGSSARIDS